MKISLDWCNFDIFTHRSAISLCNTIIQKEKGTAIVGVESTKEVMRVKGNGRTDARRNSGDRKVVQPFTLQNDGSHTCQLLVLIECI